MPDWFPDWSTEKCIIVAGGPSASSAAVEEAKALAKVIAINTSWKLAPWADVLYGCDHAWWAKANGAPEFLGLKVTQDPRASFKKEWGIHLVRTDRSAKGLVLKPHGRIGWGGHGGFHCINLAIQFGAKTIALVGYDMRVDHGIHWHGRHPQGLNNPMADTMARWRQHLDALAPKFEDIGVKIINCSEISALQAYPKMTLAEALDKG